MSSSVIPNITSPLHRPAWFNENDMNALAQNNQKISRAVACLLSGIVVVATAAAISLSGLDKSVGNVSMLFLIAVIGSAVLFGRLTAVLTSLMSFLALDFFFTQPHFHLTVQNPSEWLALCIFLLTAIVTGQLTALLRARAEEAERSKREATALAGASWVVASEPDRDKALQLVLERTVLLASISNAAIVEVDVVPSVLAKFSSSQDQVEFDKFLADCSGLQPDQAPLLDTFRVVLSQPLQDDARSSIVFYAKGFSGQPDPENEFFKAVITHLKLVIGRDALRKAEAQAAALLEADRLKTALLSMVSHDFRSPLTSIKTSVGSLLHEGLPIDHHSQASLLQGIEQETDRLNRLVGNVLDLSRLEAGAWRPRKELTPVAELISAALDAFSAEDNKRINIEIDRSIRDVSADSVQLVQVLKNLLENALKYSPPDSEVWLNVRSDDESVVFEVLDSGIGLPVGYENRIFEPFFRAPEHKQSSIPGLGIGLAVCRGLVQSQGGTLVAENKRPSGSSFRIVLPRDGA